VTSPFVQQLRARSDPIRLVQQGDEVVHLRVQVPEVWDLVQIEASPDDPVQVVKVHALERLQAGTQTHDEYVVKLRGVEILDEKLSLSDAGVRNGSTLLVTHRRRRPVR
jgi:hypothetical protein